MNISGLQYDDLGPLAQAHLFERKAERALKQSKYDEAKTHYFQAEKLITSLLEYSDGKYWNKTVIESLQAQKKFLEKQKYMIDIKRKQKEMSPKEENKKSSHELFQTISNFSTMSLDSYDSTEYYEVSTDMNITSSYRNDDVMRRMRLLIRQQQNEILALSAKLRQKDIENNQLIQKVSMLEKKVNNNMVSDSQLC